LRSLDEACEAGNVDATALRAAPTLHLCRLRDEGRQSRTLASLLGGVRGLARNSMISLCLVTLEDSTHRLAYGNGGMRLTIFRRRIARRYSRVIAITEGEPGR